MNPENVDRYYQNSDLLDMWKMLHADFVEARRRKLYHFKNEPANDTLKCEIEAMSLAITSLRNLINYMMATIPYNEIRKQRLQRGQKDKIMKKSEEGCMEKNLEIMRKFSESLPMSTIAAAPTGQSA